MLREKQVWQAEVSRGIAGGIVTQVRRGSRGKWMRAAEAPEDVRSFLCLPEKGTQVIEGITFDQVCAGGDNFLVLPVKRFGYVGGSPKSRHANVTLSRPSLVRIAVEVELPYPIRLKSVPRNVPAIRNYGQLLAHLGGDDFRRANRRIYKDTDCGAYLSVEVEQGGKRQWFHCGDHGPTGEFKLTSFLLGTIVEGSEVTFDQTFPVPVAISEVEAWVNEMEQLASDEWDSANREDAIAAEEQAIEDGQARWSETGSTRKA